MTGREFAVNVLERGRTAHGVGVEVASLDILAVGSAS